MVYDAVRNATADQRVSLHSRSGMHNAHLAKTIQIMADRINDPISPAVVAEQIGISTRQLERLFGKYLNASPKKYFMELRLDRARNLLLQTESSVTGVAFACGVESPGHFSACTAPRLASPHCSSAAAWTESLPTGQDGPSRII